MNSINESEYIVRVKNLSYAHNVKYHGNDSLKESFISIFNSPTGKRLSRKERIVIFDNVSFDLKKGEQLGVLGINGAGKTTMCRLLASFYSPDAGQVQVNGEVRAIFDTSVGIIEELTGRENATMIAELMFPNLSSEEKKEIIQDAIEFSELNEFIDIPYNKYSKGMQSRLCLSLVSSRPGDLLILDEVFDGADQFFKEKIAVRVKNMIHQSGASFIVTHNPEHLRQTCNRVIIIDDKKIVFDGAVEEGIHFYNNIR